MTDRSGPETTDCTDPNRVGEHGFVVRGQQQPAPDDAATARVIAVALADWSSLSLGSVAGSRQKKAEYILAALHAAGFRIVREGEG